MQKEKKETFVTSLWDSILYSKIVRDISWGIFEEAPRQMYEWANISRVDELFAKPNLFDNYPESFVLINWKNMPIMENIDPVWKNNTLIDRF